MKSLLTMILVCTVVLLWAQPNNPINPVPVDAGLGLLLAGGAVLGYRAVKRARRK